MGIRNSFAEHYAAMSEDDIQRLSLDVKSLAPEARTALRLEMESRRLSAENVDWNAHPSSPPSPKTGTKSNTVFALFFRNFLIFIICDVVYIAVLVPLLSTVHGVDMEALGAGMSLASLNSSLLLAFLTTRFFAPKKLKTIWIIGLAVPLGEFLLFVLPRLFH
jgi:hypothetical protein